MSREFSVIVGINATKAIAGGRQFKVGADQVNRSNRSMQRSTARTNKRMLTMITTIGRIRGVATLAFAGFLGVGGISAVVRTLAIFEAKISQVNALLGPKRGTTQIMRILTERARELGATTAFTASQAAEGMKFLTLAGFDALEVFQAIGPALTLAQAGALGLGEAADIVSNVMAAFAIDAGEVIEVVDALAFVSSRSNTNIQQLGQAMKFVAPVAGALGVSVTDTAVALGILGNAGLQASLAGTSLRRVMSGLLNPSKEATAVLSQMGLTSQELVSLLDKEDGLVLIVEKLAAAGLDAADAFTLFGQRGAPGVLALKAQRVELRNLTKATREAEGAAQDMAETMIDNLGGDAKIAISALAEGILQMGDAGLTEFLRESTQGFAGFIRGLTGMTAGLAGMSESMQAGVKNGEILKRQFDNIKKAAIVLAIVLSRGLIGAILKNAVALFNFVKLVARSIGVLVAFRSGALALTVALQGMKAAFVTSPLGIALLVGSLAAYILTGESAEEISRKQAEGLQRIVEAGEDAALTFDKVAEGQKKFKRVQITDAIKAQRQVLADANTALAEFAIASDTVSAAQQAADTASQAFTQGLEDGLGKGALAKLSDELVVASGKLTALKGTMEGTSFVELEASVEKARIKFFDFLKAASSMDEVLAGNAAFIDAVAEAAAKAARDVAELEKDFKDITGVTISWNTDLKKTVNRLLPMIAAQEKARKSLVDIRIALEKTDRQLIKMGQSREDLTRAEKEAEFQLKTSLNALDTFEKAQKKQIEQTEDLTDKIFDLTNNTGGLAALNREYTRSVAEAALAVGTGALTLDQYTERVRLLREELGLAKVALEETCQKTEKLKDCMDENAKAMEALWDQALRNIQDSFADAFKGAFDSFGDFANKLLDGFKDLFANIAAQKFLSGLFGGVSVAGILGSGAKGPAGATSTTAGGLGSLGSALTGAFGNLLTAGRFFFEGVKGFLGVGPGGSASAGALFNAGGASAGLGAVTAGAGVGALSGGITNELLGGRGKDNGKLSAIGGAIGGFFGGVLGSIVGGAIGSFASNLLGGAKALESATLEFDATAEGFNAVVETVTSKQRSFFRGRRFTTTIADADTSEFDEALAAVITNLTATAEALGVDAAAALANFNFTSTIDIKGKSEEQIAALLENLFNDVLTGIVTEFVDNAEGLSTRLVATVNTFKGNADEFVRAFQLAAAIDLAFLVEPVTAVTDALAEENKSLTTSYQGLLETYRSLISEFDGSLSSLEELSAATVIVTQAQLQLTAALLVAGQEITSLFQGSAQTIRESLLNEEELFNLRKSQIDALVSQIGNTTDPAELQALAEEINRLGLDAFNLLDDSQQSTLGDEFIQFFEGLDSLFGEQVRLGLSTVTEDSNALNQEVADTMTAAAQSIIDSNNSARDLFIDFRDFINERRANGEFFTSELQLS